ncbi:hypothetical protein Prum_022070 [Phytohabitans rumicis]|uniref:Uncharacterized protein n=1 Tax=Phytohabitans rumicis TaxID=1076125 RepID=A0A6V8L7D3_9ACTN|nr:hypothetical protein Prum_022070 [Phytohabitans rumicis]
MVGVDDLHPDVPDDGQRLGHLVLVDHRGHAPGALQRLAVRGGLQGQPEREHHPDTAHRQADRQPRDADQHQPRTQADATPPPHPLACKEGPLPIAF